MKSLQKFSSVHAAFHNHFNKERHLTHRESFKAQRSAALAEEVPPDLSREWGRGLAPEWRQVVVGLTAPPAIQHSLLSHEPAPASPRIRGAKAGQTVPAADASPHSPQPTTQ